MPLAKEIVLEVKKVQKVINFVCCTMIPLIFLFNFSPTYCIHQVSFGLNPSVMQKTNSIKPNSKNRKLAKAKDFKEVLSKPRLSEIETIIMNCQ